MYKAACQIDMCDAKIKRLKARVAEEEAIADKAEDNHNKTRQAHLELKLKFEEQVKTCDSLTMELTSRASKLKDMEK